MSFYTVKYLHLQYVKLLSEGIFCCCISSVFMTSLKAVSTQLQIQVAHFLFFKDSHPTEEATATDKDLNRTNLDKRRTHANTYCTGHVVYN